MAELITIKHYWQQWDDGRLIVAVLHNNDLNQVTWEMRAMGGAPKFADPKPFTMSTTPRSPRAWAWVRSPLRIPASWATRGIAR